MLMTDELATSDCPTVLIPCEKNVISRTPDVR